VNKVRLLALILTGATALCLLGLRGARTQSSSLRRVTNTTEEGVNINPSISGDGRILAFESTEDIASAGGADHFRAIRANVGLDPASFFQMGGTRAVAPAISQDGSRIAFASKDDPLGTNTDGNSEIFLFDGAKLTQVTNTSPGDVANRVKNGNFQPSISDDGRFIAFSSNRDLAGQNADGNLEVFIYDSVAGSFTQATNTSGIVGASDAKISGNGSSVAYIRDNGTTPSAQCDLMEQPRTGPGPAVLLAGNVLSLAMTYGRAISDDGTRVVYAAETATNSTQVFLYDGRGGSAVKQITALGVRATEVPLHPTISGDGTRIAFAARRSVPGATADSDGGVDLYVHDIPSSQVSKITNAPSSATADVVSSLNDDGSIVAFNFPRILSGAVVNSDTANNSEIYITATPPRPASGVLTVLNGASFGKEPSTSKAVAPDSIAVATGGALANATQQSQKLPNGIFPTNVGGTTVTVNGRAAQIFFVSPGQVNFLVPPQTEIGTADVAITNSENFTSRGIVPTLRAAPGVFTKSGDGTGAGVLLNSDTLLEAPFDPTNGSLRLTIFTTGARNAGQNVISMGGRVVNADAVVASPDMPGLDEVHVLVPADLRGAGTVDLFVQSDGRASNPVSITFSGDASRDIAINEVLVDPPTGTAGDANLDGTRDSAQDEFVEFVNATTHDIDISGFQLQTRSSTTTTDSLQHTFAGGTILPACSAIVVFGGGTFDPASPAFGGAQVVKASTNGLSLSNSGGVVTLRNQAGAIVTFLSYGGSTGLNGQANQSLTRSPDVNGPFTLHQSATGNGGRLFSPGTRVNGSPFTACPPIVRIAVSPQSAAVDAGAKQQFTAQAFDSANNPVTGVIFSWQSSTTTVATIDQNGLATSSTAGSTEIRASARGLQSLPATLTVREVQRVLTRVDVTPPTATVAATGAQQFTAHGIDQFGNEIAGLTFAWESSNTATATIDQAGLATGVTQGQSTIKATTQNQSGTATLNVTAPTMVVNEVLADPPTGTDGDANHDGTRDAADDEFVELVNATNSPINISGWTLRTHSTTSATETVRHTFAANTNFPAGEAMVVFGGGTFSPADPLFGCAQIVKASSGGLSLTNGGLTILVRDGSGNLVTQFSYGGTTGLNGGNAQSLTRSPDINGSFVLHTTIAGARKFSSGLKVDGTPFGNCPGHPATVTISPATSSVIVGQTTQFTAQAFDEFGRAMTGMPIMFTSDNTSVATVESVSTNPSTGIATATVKGQGQSTAHITAQSNDGTTTAISSPATLTVIPPQPSVSRIDVSPAAATINRGSTLQFSATAFDQNNQPVAGVFFTWSSSNTNAATIDQNGLASGGGIGATNITASASDGASGTVSGTATLNVQIPLVINEINADVGPDNVATTAVEGDANRDGVRDASDDEFIELLNNSPTAVNISGVIIADATSNRFTIPANTTLAAGRALVIFGGGSPPASDPAFGGALVLALTGSGTLSLNDTGDTVNVRLNVGGSDVLVASQIFGGAGNPAAPSDQSLSRSPDAEINSAGGGFGAHTAAFNPAGRVFSPGTRTDGTPFGSPAITRIDVTPASATVNAGQTQAFTARAFSNVGGPEVEVQNVCFIWDSSDPSRATVAPITGLTTTATGVGGGSPTIRARAGGQLGTATLTVNVPPTLTINDVLLNEGNSGTTTFHFVVSLSAPALAGGVTFDIATQDGTATIADSDYVARSLSSQTIAAGQQTYNFDVTVSGDTNIEPNEAFLVNVTNVAGATVGDGQGGGTIQNDDSPSLNINDVSATEGNSGTTTFTFTVTSTLPAPAGGITFDIATADSTASTASGDYVARSLTNQNIPAGQTTYTFDVTVNGELLVESDEAFLVNVTPISGAIPGDTQGSGTIQNDDAGNLVISQLYGGGDNTGAPFRNDFVEVYNRGTTTVDFAVTPYSIQYAGVGSNFGSSKTNLTSGIIGPGRYFLIQESGGTTNGVALPAPDATGTIALAGTAGKVALVAGTNAMPAATCPGDDSASPFNPINAAIADLVGYGNSATTAGHCYEGTGPAAAPSNTTADFRKAGGCIDTNDNAADFFVASPNPRNSGSPVGDCKADITINDVTVTEANTGTVNATFTVSLSAASANTVTVNYATADGTATQPADYQSQSGVLTFNPGDLTKTVTVLVNGDTLDEVNEIFFVNLSSATNGALVDSQGQGTITDNDPAPSLSINDVSIAEGDSATTPATFTVTLSLASGQTVTVNYATADNTAAAGSDYQSTSGTLTFNPGDNTKTISVLLNGDTTFEQAETFLVNLSGPTNATISDNQGLGTITNDDPAPPTPTFSITDVSVAEGNAGTSNATFTVTLSPSSSQTVTVDFATADGTATIAGNDYQSATGTLTFNPGDTSKPINVVINGDTLVEPDETLLVKLTNATGGATIGVLQSVGTIQNDDTPLVVISQVYGGGGNSGATYRNDFIEVFNRGTTTVDLAGWSVQENSASSTSAWSVTPLCSAAHCLLSPGQYYLIQEASGGAGGVTLPTPDASGSIGMSASTGKVALVSNTSPLSGACPSGPTIFDRVGYGGTAGTVDFCFEGTAPAPTPSATVADLRAAAGCTDTNDNAADFATGSPNPRNTAFPLHDCNAPPTLTSVTIAPPQSTIGVGDTQQFTGQALDQFGQPIGGAAVTFASNDTDVATVDSVGSTSGTGSATASVTGRGTGSTGITATATNGGTNVNSGPATISVEPAAGQVLISEFRTRGTGGATDEFMEIYNPTASSVLIGGLVIRTSNNAGTLTTRATIAAGTTLGPGCHYLFAPTTFSGTGTTPPDQTFTNGITDDGGVAITRSDLVTIIDAVGMSAGSAYKENTTLTPLAGTTNQSYERKPGGAAGNGTDTNNNAADFFLNSGTSNPQNSSSVCLNSSTADLSMGETDSPDPVMVGSDITYTLTVANNGIGVAQSLVVTDNLPASLTYVSCGSTGGGVCGGTGNNRTVSFSSLPIGSAATITLVATVNGTGGASISNTASVSAATTDLNSSNDSATTTTTVSSADLSITKLDSPDPVNAGENITYTLVVTNNSSTIPAQSVTVSDQVPANTTFVSVGATPAGWTRTDSTTVGQTGAVTYTLPTMAANGTATFTITVKVDSNVANNSVISNTATVSSNTPDGNSANNSAPQTTTVRTPADLSLSKTVNNASPNVGEQVTFTITMNNSGPYAATGVTVKDQLPAGLTYVSDDGGGAYSSGSSVWTVGPISASASATLHITAQATAAAVGGSINTAEITASDQFDPDSTPNNHNPGEDDQSSLTVTAKSADLSLTKTVNNSSPTVSQDVIFTITLSNAGPDTATNVQVTDPLPAGLGFVSSTQSQGSYGSSSGIWTVGSVNASGTATLTITATVQSAGTVTNTAEVTACDVFDPDSAPNNHTPGEDDQASRTISSLQADLSLLKTVNNATPNVGENVIFTIVVTNAGPSDATNVKVKDLLPAGLAYVSDDGGGAYVSGTGILTIGTMNASTTATLHITATATSRDPVTNTAEVSASDVPDPDSAPNNHIGSEDDQSSVIVNAKDADLSITKTDSPDPVLAGSNITYTINVTNGGPDPSLNLTLSDTVPANTTFQSLTPAGNWTCPTVPPVGGTGAISCTASSLAASQTDSFTLVVKVNSGVAGSTTISNAASVSSSTTFDPTTPNSVTQTTTVRPSANLSITKSDAPDRVAVGNDITYTITVTNAGLDAAASAVFSDTVPANTTFRSITTPGGWTCGTVPSVGGTGSISCSNPSFAAGSAIFTLVVRVNPSVTDGTTITNGTASVTSSTFDPDLTNNDNSAAPTTTTAKTPLLVISQVYGGGGLTGATYKNDFIEIFNRGTTTVNFTATPYSVQYANATVAFAASKTDITSGSIAPGQYFLIQEISGGVNGATLAADLTTGTINLNANSGKVALVFGTTLLAGTCPGDDGSPPFNPAGSGIVDFLGYGFGASTDNPNCFEGAARATTASATANAKSITRNSSCIDTDNNGSDFSYPAGAPTARNSGTTIVPCGP